MLVSSNTTLMIVMIKCNASSYFKRTEDIEIILMWNVNLKITPLVILRLLS